jgi:putative hemolysin
LTVRLARTEREIEAAQRLRYEVFNLAEGLGLTDSTVSGLDQDPYDPYCDHLLVVDESQQIVVGTYRLLPAQRVPSFGFYSETEFDLTRVRRSGLRLLEVGRSCVAPGYRHGRIIDLLFRGLGEYVGRTGSQALMGCVSVHGRDVELLRALYHWVQAEGLAAPEHLSVAPLPSHVVPGVEVPPETIDPRLAQQIPPLFRAYLNLGARVCGLPAYDAAFGTTDFFVLLDLTRVAGPYARRFLAGEA